MPNMIRIPRFFLLALVAVASLQGCASVRYETYSRLTPRAVRGVILTADGAGGYNGTSSAMKRAIDEGNIPLAVETVHWTHGRGRSYSDQTDVAHSREQGRQLAAHVLSLRAQTPNLEVYLVGHSAGAAVALAAAESLPPGTIDHVVLLAPSVSSNYDLRQALRGSRDGVDVFCSERDWFYLGLGVDLIGTADGGWDEAAGRKGFRPTIGCPEDAALHSKLHQHPWDECLEWSGNHGGHYGAYQQKYLRAYVLPLFTRSIQFTNSTRL